MSELHDSPNALRSMLHSLKGRGASKEGSSPSASASKEVLSADDYPTLNLLSSPKRPVEKQEVESSLTSAARIEASIDPIHFRSLGPELCGALFHEMLEGGFLETFRQAVELIQDSLASEAPDSRRWAVESMRALTSPEDLRLIPNGTFDLLLDSLGRVLAREERVGLREAILETAAQLLGTLVAMGDLEGAQAHLARIEQESGPRGAECRSRILSSRSLAMPPLQLFFREGRARLESLILPFFRFTGELGAGTLILLLSQEQNRHYRNRILEILKRLGPACLPAVKEGLVAGPWYLVRNALNLVGDLEETEAFEYVVPCLENPDVRIRRVAVRALWKTGGPRAESYLLELLPNSEIETQHEVLIGLGQLRSTAAVPLIAPLVSASFPEPLRIKAIETLGQIGVPGSVPALAELLQRRGRIFKKVESAPVRLATARALALIGTPEARGILDHALAEEPQGASQNAFREAATAPHDWA